MEYILRDIIRYWRVNLITVGIVVLLVLFLDLYVGNIEGNKRQLHTLSEAMPVQCRITNLNGELISRLEIDEELIERLQNSTYIRDLAYTARLMGGEGQFPIEEWKEMLTLHVIGANQTSAVPGLKQEALSMPENETEQFFLSAAAECLVNMELLEEKGWSVGDKIVITLYYCKYNGIAEVQYSELEPVTVKIAGTMQNIMIDNSGIRLDLVFPVRTVRSIYQMNGVEFSADTASFYVTNPLELNAFKEEMKSFGLLPRSTDAQYSHKGIALSVKDTMFISMANKLKVNIQSLEAFFVPVCGLILLISYIANFLAMHSRKKDFVCMRLLGLKTYQCLGYYGVEEFLLVLTGFFCGYIVQSCIGETHVFLKTGILVICCCLAGAMFALTGLGKMQILKILNQKEE